MEWIKIFSLELGRCYIEQNLEFNDKEMEECFEEDKTILEGVLMSLLSEQLDIIKTEKYLESLYTKEIWVYGSLRKGEYNNYLLKNSKYIGKGIVKGFKMYSLGSYPFVYQTNNKDDTIVVEGYKIDIEIYDLIEKMEKSSGYTKVDVAILINGVETLGKIYKIDDPIRYYDKVVSGDWVAEKETRYLNANR